MVKSKCLKCGRITTTGQCYCKKCLSEFKTIKENIKAKR